MKKAPDTLPNYVINIFFLIGLTSALSFRLLIAVQNLCPEFFRPLWYFGIIGYIIFFSFRYIIAKKRRNIIEEYDLINKVKVGGLSEDDRQAIAYLLMSIRKSRENLNYLFIFVTSTFAIFFDLLLA